MKKEKEVVYSLVVDCSTELKNYRRLLTPVVRRVVYNEIPCAQLFSLSLNCARNLASSPLRARQIPSQSLAAPARPAKCPVNAAILRFLRHFRDPRDAGRVDPVMDEGKYMRSIHRILELEGGESLNVDAHDVFDHDPDLYGKMVRYPLEVLAIFDIVLMDLVARIEPLFEKHIQTRIYNLKSSICLRNLNPSDIEKMVSIKGMIIRCSSVIPELKEAVFRCLVCGFYSEPVMVDRDKQIIKLQETPDEIAEGGTPHTVSVLMHDKLVDAGKPGDRVEITGIYRAMSIRIGPTQRTVKSIFKVEDIEWWPFVSVSTPAVPAIIVSVISFK